MADRSASSTHAGRTGEKAHAATAVRGYPCSMASPVHPSDFKEVLIILGAAGVVFPLFHRLRVSPVLGFLLVGMAVGPSGLGALARQVPWLEVVTITDAASIGPIADLGVVMLLFMIGLELSLERLLLMWRLVFGLGSLQVISLLPRWVTVSGVPATQGAARPVSE